MDQETRKSMHRFIKRPTWNGSYAILANLSVRWNWWSGLFGSALDPDVQAILLLSAIPEEEANCFLECTIYLGLSYNDIWGILGAEGQDLVNPDVVEDDWEDSVPDGDEALAYRLWFTSWCVKLAKVAKVTNRHAKKRYTRPLSTVGGRYDEPHKEFVEEEELQGREFTYMEADNFILPKLLTNRRSDAIHGYRQGSSGLNRLGGDWGKGGRRSKSEHTPDRRQFKCGGSETNRSACETCGGQHATDRCWITHPEYCWWLRKAIEQALQNEAEYEKRFKAGKSITCGQDPHPPGVRCPKRPPLRSADGSDRKGVGTAARGTGLHCFQCVQEKHKKANCPENKNKEDKKGVGKDNKKS